MIYCFRMKHSKYTSLLIYKSQNMWDRVSALSFFYIVNLESEVMVCLVSRKISLFLFYFYFVIWVFNEISQDHRRANATKGISEDSAVYRTECSPYVLSIPTVIHATLQDSGRTVIGAAACSEHRNHCHQPTFRFGPRARDRNV